MNGPALHLEPRPSVLLIDDDSSVLDGLVRVFASIGFDTLSARSGAAGIELLQKSSPDLVITDLCMADIDGWDVLFHERMERPDLPIFVITGLAPEATGGANRFATAFFSKPLDFDAVVNTARHHLQCRKAEWHASSPPSAALAAPLIPASGR